MNHNGISTYSLCPVCGKTPMSPFPFTMQRPRKLHAVSSEAGRKKQTSPLSPPARQLKLAPTCRRQIYAPIFRAISDSAERLRFILLYNLIKILYLTFSINHFLQEAGCFSRPCPKEGYFQSWALVVLY